MLGAGVGLFAFGMESWLLLSVAIFFFLLTLVLGISSRRRVARSDGTLRDLGFTIGAVIFVVIFIGEFFGFPRFCKVREAAARIMASNDMKQIGLALHNYADGHGGRLPPAVLYDKSGKPLHSWRVLLLPYLEEDNLYREFHLDEPWDSPHNFPLQAHMPRVYGLPRRDYSGEKPAGPSETLIQVFVGKGTAFEGNQGLRLPEDFPDGTSNTILLIEAGKGVPWTKPVDLTYEPGQPLPSLGGAFPGPQPFFLWGSNYRAGMHVGFADGSVRFFELGEVGEDSLREMILRNDGKRGPQY
jgi:hypothetical protein